jgi:ammonia channel protein AmtB
VLLKLIDKFVGLRLSDEHEVIGLDISQHSVEGYDMG